MSLGVSCAGGMGCHVETGHPVLVQPFQQFGLQRLNFVRLISGGVGLEGFQFGGLKISSLILEDDGVLLACGHELWVVTKIKDTSNRNELSPEGGCPFP